MPHCQSRGDCLFVSILCKVRDWLCTPLRGELSPPNLGCDPQDHPESHHQTTPCCSLLVSGLQTLSWNLFFSQHAP